MNKLVAKLMLALTFFGHLFLRLVLFWRKKNGITQFLSHFRSDCIFPVGTLERARMPSYQRCQACSLCTFSCDAVASGRAPSGFEPKYILLSAGRSSHESEFFLNEWIPCLQCGSCTVLCPNDVPVHAMAQEIIERRKNFAFRK